MKRRQLPLWNPVLPGIILLVTFACTQPVAGPVYKWTDEHGHVHFGDKPHGADARQVHIEAAPPPDQHAQQRRLQQRKLLEIYTDERHEQEELAARNKAREKQRRKKCAWAKNDLQRFERAAWVYDVDAGGNRVPLPEARRQANIERARKDVKEFCGH